MKAHGLEALTSVNWRKLMSKQSVRNQSIVKSSEGDSMGAGPSSHRLAIDLNAGKLSYRLRELRGILMAKGVSLDYYSKSDFLGFCLRELTPEREDDKLLAAAIISLTMIGGEEDGKELLTALESVEEKYFEMMMGILASEKMKPERIKKWLSINIDFFQKTKVIEYTN